MTFTPLPGGVQLVEPIIFDRWIYPVKALLTTDGVQYDTVVTNQTDDYKDLFSIDTHTYFPFDKGLLAWVYVNISFILWAASADPVASWKIEARNKDGEWTIMSEVETQDIAAQTSEGAALAERLEGYLLLGSTINKAPFSIRLRFKSNGTADNDKVSMRLKNDTVIRYPGSREMR